MRGQVCRWLALALVSACVGTGHAQESLFKDNFNGELSDKWQPVGLQPESYRIRNGALELRLQPQPVGARTPMLKVDLPFTTAETVKAAVEVSVGDQPLRRGEFAGLALIDEDGIVFSGKKTNIDGYYLLSPGLPEFIGTPGQEGDPANYTVKYWPATDAAGPLNVLVRHHYAHFQVGPAPDGKYKTFFHSAITEADGGLGIALIVGGDASSDATERWVRFDNFRVWKP